MGQHLVLDSEKAVVPENVSTSRIATFLYGLNKTGGVKTSDSCVPSVACGISGKETLMQDQRSFKFTD